MSPTTDAPNRIFQIPPAAESLSTYQRFPWPDALILETV